MALATILLVEDDPPTLAMVRKMIAREGAFRVETAVNGREGWARARALLPDLIISDFEMPEMNGFELCQRVKADPATAGTMFVVLTAHADTAHKVQGLDVGVDDYMAKPVEPAEFIAKIRAMLRLKTLHDRLRASHLTLAQLNEQLKESFEQLLQLLVHFLDLRVPGAAARGRRVSGIAKRIAERMEVPPEFVPDLITAAQVCEVGRIGAADRNGAGREFGGPGIGAGGWRYLVDSAVILEQVERIKPVAELVQAIGEHWDGTGLPRHERMGQIPLRSRILRVAIDFLVAIEAPEVAGDPHDAFARIARHAGTYYDPAVVAQLEATLGERPGEKWDSGKRQVSVEALEEGMVLADDLLTSSGVKLLTTGSAITKAMRNVIQRRHQIDPIVYGVWVRRGRQES